MSAMWEILGRSTPPSRQRGPSNEHSVTKSEVRLVGNPFAGIHSSFSQLLISSVSSEVRSSKPPSRNLRFESLLIRREVRVLGSRPSSGKDSTLLHPPSISKQVRDAIPCKPHSFWGVRLLQLLIIRDCKLRGKLPCENWESSGQLDISNFWRHGRQVCNLLLGSDFRFGQSLISISWRNVRTTSLIERDLRFLQSSIWRYWNLVNKPNCRDSRESQLFAICKRSRTPNWCITFLGRKKFNILQWEIETDFNVARESPPGKEMRAGQLTISSCWKQELPANNFLCRVVKATKPCSFISFKIGTLWTEAWSFWHPETTNFVKELRCLGRLSTNSGHDRIWSSWGKGTLHFYLEKVPNTSKLANPQTTKFSDIWMAWLPSRDSHKIQNPAFVILASLWCRALESNLGPVHQ